MVITVVHSQTKAAPKAKKIASRTYLAMNAVRQRLSPAITSIPILSFHRVSEIQPEHFMTFHPQAFEQVLREMKRHYSFVTLAEIDELLTRRRIDVPVAGVSFDDSYGCNATYAVPVLESLRIPATFFVSSAFVDSDEPMPDDRRLGYSGLPNFTSAELRTMAEHPLFEIGSHTVNHIDLSRPWDGERITREMVDSKRALEGIIGRAVERLAFPIGSLAHCHAQAIRIAREAGYKRVYSFFGGRNKLTEGRPPGFVLQRICSVYSDTDYVRACLENFRGRQTLIRPRLSSDFHATEF